MRNEILAHISADGGISVVGIAVGAVACFLVVVVVGSWMLFRRD